MNTVKTKWIFSIITVFCVLFNGGAILPLVAQQIPEKKVKAPRKRALLIGISKYQRTGKPGEWADLNTALDIELLKKILVDKFRFAPDDITVLKDDKATKAGILSEWKKIVAQTDAGDVFFVHFSGHGNSIQDDNGDEIDGKDESLIPFDYVSKKDPSNDIRDDEIGKILDDLKLKKPANVTVSIDSCFSGTATRGDYAVRGGGEDIIKPEDESPSGLEDKNNSYPKEYIFLAAASPRQTAKETDFEDKGRVGVYTLALTKALTEATPRTTYRDLFERINDIVTTIRRDQNPQFEGSLDEAVFDGTAIPQERFATVRPLASGKKEDRAILQMGNLQGVTVKSRFALFEAGTKDPAEKGAVKIAEGEIVETDAITSVLKLDRQVDPEKIRTARAFETQHYYSDTMLKVVLQNMARTKDGEAVLAEFVKKNSRGDAPSENGISFDLAEFTEANPNENLRGEFYDVKIYPAGAKEVKDKIVTADFTGIVMERKDGSVLAAIPAGKNYVKEIKLALERENRFRTVKNLKDSEDPRLKIALRVIPVAVTLDSAGRIKTAVPKGEMPRNEGGQAQVKLDDYIMLEVENQGDLDVYVTILNLRADGKVGPGFPQKVEGTPDNFLAKGKKLLIPMPYVFRITEPLGEESFRAIATIEPTDFTPLIDEDLIRRGGGRGERGDAAAVSPIGKILLAAQQGKRSGLAASVPPSWATSSFTYLVKEK